MVKQFEAKLAEIQSALDVGQKKKKFRLKKYGLSQRKRDSRVWQANTRWKDQTDSLQCTNESGTWFGFGHINELKYILGQIKKRITFNYISHKRLKH